MDANWREYHVSVFHKGIPVHLVTVTDNNIEDAIRRSVNGVFMAALMDGREFRKDDLHGSEFLGEVPA
jgi:hypothetical protein